MEKELKELDRRVFDRRRRSEGTACVLIHGQPGAGKSHLARQYVHKNSKKFDGGIFWINARLKEEIYQAYWNIAQKVVLRDSPHLQLTPDGIPRPFEEIVKIWFEGRHDWLIVFDGIAVDKEEDAIELQSFIPDRKDSSIIYVSRASNLGTKRRLLTPFPIKVHALSEDDARRLLFKELHIKKPTEGEVKSATELVRKMGGLPLAIHAISHRLGETHEPLIKYNMKSYSADPKVGGTYKAIMDDLMRLKHQGAWNTISIICFYGGHLPVEMIRLGIKALRPSGIEVNSSWDGERPDLDITFAILMRNAMIERNEPDERSPISASRDNLIDPEPIDMLKMHSVVQNFCCDFLNSAHVLPRWLGYAVDVFCESFRQADEKIKAKPLHGRVSDYREYLVHGKRLFDHSREYQTKKQNLEAVRNKLIPILAKISAEIRAREPGSSQESVCGQIVQISVFDRSSSTSDSVASEHEVHTPTHRPSPLMPGDAWYGGDLGKVQVKTPTSIRSNSPRIVDHSPQAQLPHFLDDQLYDMDRDEPPQSHSMRHGASDSTARPHVPRTASQDGGWQTVQPSKRVTRAREFPAAPTSSNYGRPRHHRDLGSFRPTPSRAGMTGITNVDAVGLFSQPGGERRRNLSGGSDAVTSLTAVHHSSPPASRDSSRSHQRSHSRPRTSVPIQPTYAMIAAGEQPQQPVASQLGGFGYDGTGMPRPYPFVPAPSGLQRNHSPESIRGRSGNIKPSPLATEFKPRQRNTHATSNETSPYAAPPVYQGSLQSTPDHSPPLRYVNTQLGSNFSPPQSPHLGSEHQNRVYYIGPNPATLSLEENISITPKRRMPPDFQIAPPLPYLQSQHPNPHTTAYPLSFDPTYHPAPIPAGYASHPMTRDHSSRQSHSSAAATDPLLYHTTTSPRFSPHVSVLNFANSFQRSEPFGAVRGKGSEQGGGAKERSKGAEQRTGAKGAEQRIRAIRPKYIWFGLYLLVHSQHSGQDISPRDRTADGRPLSKSPKLYHAVPVAPDPHACLSGTGGWAVSSPTMSPTTSPAMSRAGSGPGVAVGEPGQMEIAEFGKGLYGGAQVQFGEHAPVVIEEGRGRVREWERRLREREGRSGSGSGSGSGERGRSRGRLESRGGRGVPYPETDVMPGEGGVGGGVEFAVLGVGLGLEFEP